jgi:acyl-CoA synthetase (AMP-forming)/AMP-acid ligase II
MSLLHLLDVPDQGRPALCSRGDLHAITYGELEARATDLASQLRSIGVEPGTRVALVFSNGPELIQLLLGVASVGAIAAPLNPAYTATEYAFYLGEIEPGFVLLPPGDHAIVRRVAGRARIVDAVCPGDGTVDLGVRASASGRSPASPDDVALLLHTSGTTSRPKKVPLLHRNLASSAVQIARHYGLTSEDVSYCAMPLFHVHGLVASVLATFAAGGTVVVPHRVGPRRFERDLSRYGVTWLSAAPTLLGMLLEGLPAAADGAFPRLRFARTSSSPLPLRLLTRAEERVGVPVVEAYGMTEASHQISSNPLPPDRSVPGTVGIATGTELMVIEGEVAIRGPGVMPGYLDDGESNKEAFVAGWFRTGDLGTIEDGYLRLTGRLKEMIIRGGENVSPYEVEQALLRHPAIEDAVCFGVPSEKYGEEVSAAVRCRAEVTERELVRHCREHLAAYKAPKTIRIVEAIPRTATGKVQRRKMARLLAEQPASMGTPTVSESLELEEAS